MSKLVLRLRGAPALKIDKSPYQGSPWTGEGVLVDPKLFPHGTCTSCRKITLDNIMYEGRPPFSPSKLYLVIKCWLDYVQDPPANCPMCKMIFDSIRLGRENATIRDSTIGLGARLIRRRPRIREIHVFEPRVDWSYDPNQYGRIRIHAEPGKPLTPFASTSSPQCLTLVDSYASKFVEGRRAPSSNLSASTFEKICYWISDCDETHTTCRIYPSQSLEARTRYLPTRVVHVGSTTRQPHLYISQSQQSDRYIALSHCWGTHLPIRTLKANLEQLKEEIILDSLPKTFQDAIRVARRLGIEYIWIDSLCIVQDNENDWIRESERMGGIYMNAYITIAATSATDGTGGLDSIRPQRNWIKFPCDGSDEVKGYMWFSDASWTAQTDLLDAPLNTRGWVFQEKMLSRRIIHYTASQVYWQCRQRFAGEEHDPASESSITAMEPAKFWYSVNKVPHVGMTPTERTNEISDINHSFSFYSYWRDLIHHYCTRKFTKKSDRLVALLGIIRLIEERTGLRCVDGHWDDGSWKFVQELLWHPEEQITLTKLDNGSQSRLCSSWSWASLEGKLESLDGMNLLDGTREAWNDYGLKNCDLHLEAIEHAVYVPWRSHPLKVSGMLRTFYKGEFTGSTRRGCFAVKAEGSGVAGGWVYFDRDDEEPEMFYFTPVYVRYSVVACLALVQRYGVCGKKRCFERVGVGEINFDREDRWRIERKSTELFETCERSTYYII